MSVHVVLGVEGRIFSINIFLAIVRFLRFLRLLPGVIFTLIVEILLSLRVLILEVLLFVLVSH